MIFSSPVDYVEHLIKRRKKPFLDSSTNFPWSKCPTVLVQISTKPRSSDHKALRRHRSLKNKPLRSPNAQRVWTKSRRPLRTAARRGVRPVLGRENDHDQRRVVTWWIRWHRWKNHWGSQTRLLDPGNVTEIGWKTLETPTIRFNPPPSDLVNIPYWRGKYTTEFFGFFMVEEAPSELPLPKGSAWLEHLEKRFFTTTRTLLGKNSSKHP